MTDPKKQALEALGLDVNASYNEDALKKAYRKNALRVHPDKVEENARKHGKSPSEIEDAQKQATKDFQALTEAYQYLLAELNSTSANSGTKRRKANSEPPFFGSFFNFGFAEQIFETFFGQSGEDPSYANEDYGKKSPTPQTKYFVEFEIIKKFGGSKKLRVYLQPFEIEQAARKIQTHLNSQFTQFTGFRFVSTNAPGMAVEIAESLYSDVFYGQNSRVTQFEFSGSILLNHSESRKINSIQNKLRQKRINQNIARYGQHALAQKYKILSAASGLVPIALFFSNIIIFSIAQMIMFSSLLAFIGYKAGAYYHKRMVEEAKYYNHIPLSKLTNEQVEALWVGTKSKTWTGYFSYYLNKSSFQNYGCYCAGKIFGLEEEAEFMDVLNKEHLRRSHAKV